VSLARWPSMVERQGQVKDLAGVDRAAPHERGQLGMSGPRASQPIPFDLIRWLARSQSDPRKAVAELVQSSLNADARRVTPPRAVTHLRRRLTRRDGPSG
jgi:hypothetical protein